MQCVIRVIVLIVCEIRRPAVRRRWSSAVLNLVSIYYRAESQLFAALYNKDNFGEKIFTSTKCTRVDLDSSKLSLLHLEYVVFRGLKYFNLVHVDLPIRTNNTLIKRGAKFEPKWC